MDAHSSALRKPEPTFAALKNPPIVVKRPRPNVTQDASAWIISEDYSLLQVIQNQGLPLSLTRSSRIPNWDLAADFVNTVSPKYRSPRNCESHFAHLVFKEKGEFIIHNNPEKPKKTKEIFKTKNNRPMKTSHLYQMDRNADYTRIFCKRANGILELAQRRTAQAECVKIQKSTQNIPIGMSYFNDCDNEPLSPIRIVSNCQERIQREKQKNQSAGVVAATPSLPGIQHTATTLRGELCIVVSAQTTTLPTTTLTTSNVLKGTDVTKCEIN